MRNKISTRFSFLEKAPCGDGHSQKVRTRCNFDFPFALLMAAPFTSGADAEAFMLGRLVAAIGSSENRMASSCFRS